MDAEEQAVQNARLCFEQTCEMARHYGNLRFAMSTLHATLLGGLFYVQMTTKMASFAAYMFFGFAIALAFLFIRAEFRVSALVYYYQGRIKNKKMPLAFPAALSVPGPKGDARWRQRAKWIMVAPSVLAMLWWVASIIGHVLEYDMIWTTK